jgi:hypothetical protein
VMVMVMVMMMMMMMMMTTTTTLVIPPLPKTLHPTDIPLRDEQQPVFYMKGLVRAPPQRPKFDRELQAVLNPIEFILRPESIANLAAFADSIMPYTEQLVKRALIKPPGDLSKIMVVEPKDSLEDLVSLKVEVWYWLA